MSSPSRYRREGRNAFYRGGNPISVCPYPAGHHGANSWLDGWLEAEKEDERRIKDEERADLEDFDKVQEFARLYNLAKEQGLIS
jgi:ribosome modulation factor